ncbi:CCHC-type domain-containing protein [Entamoeba marina]
MTTFYYKLPHFTDYKPVYLKQSSVTIIDVKKSIIHENRELTPPQLRLYEKIGDEMKPITNENIEIRNNTYIIVRIDKVNTKEERKIQHDENVLEDVFVGTTQKINSMGLFNSKTRKQQPKTLPPDYVCRRCGKKGHYIKDCPENNNPLYDNKEVAGLPQEFLCPADENDPNALLTKDGKKVKTNITGMKFKPTVTSTSMSEEHDIPKALKCPICSGLMRGASILWCCNVSLCQDCVKESTNNERCLSCGKVLDIGKGINADERIRKLVMDYFNEINAKIAKNATIKIKNDVPIVQDTQNVIRIAEQIPHKPVIPRVDISEIYNPKSGSDSTFKVWELSKLNIPNTKFEGVLFGLDRIDTSKFFNFSNGEDDDEDENKRERSKSRGRNKRDERSRSRRRSNSRRRDVEKKRTRVA